MQNFQLFQWDSGNTVQYNVHISCHLRNRAIPPRTSLRLIKMFNDELCLGLLPLIYPWTPLTHYCFLGGEGGEGAD
jgi:hypothetical protein